MKQTDTIKNIIMFLLIDKPANITSHDVVDRIRAITREKTVGHAGTLDPFATGLLIIGVGRNATKQLSHFLHMDKHYRATMCLGATSDTQDKTGMITPTTQTYIQPTREIIEQTLKHFTGNITQIPPMYSAKKMNGKKLYELAREGKQIERKPCAISIYSLALESYEWPLAELSIHCSSGTYIRTLCADIGNALQAGAYCSSLTRTAIGNYQLKNAISLSVLTPLNWLEHTFTIVK